MALCKDGHCVCFAARNFLDFHLAEGYDQFGLGLVGAAIFVLRHTGRVRMAQLPAATATPGVESALVGQCDRARIATCYLNDLDCLQ